VRKTKIVCTIGPATESPEMIRKLILSGMNVARLNTSHDTPEHHRERIRSIKSIRDELGIPVRKLWETAGA